MKKMIILSAVAFVVALAAGVGGRMALAPAPAPVEAAAEHGADAKASMTEGVDPLAVDTHGESHADDLTAEEIAAQLEAAVTVDLGAVHKSESPGKNADGTPISSVDFREISRVLGSIEPSEASMFLTHLDDDRVLGILRSMNVRQVTSILALFPETRAHSLRLRLLEPHPEVK